MGCGSSAAAGGGGGASPSNKYGAQNRIKKFNDSGRNLQEILDNQENIGINCEGSYMVAVCHGSTWFKKGDHTGIKPCQIVMAEGDLFIFKPGPVSPSTLYDVCVVGPWVLPSPIAKNGLRDNNVCIEPYSVDENPEWGIRGGEDAVSMFVFASTGLNKIEEVLRQHRKNQKEFHDMIHSDHDVFSLTYHAYDGLTPQQKQNLAGQIENEKKNLIARLWRAGELQAERKAVEKRLLDLARSGKQDNARIAATGAWLNDNRPGLEKRGLDLSKYTGIMDEINSNLQEFKGNAGDLDSHMRTEILESPPVQLIFLLHRTREDLGKYAALAQPIESKVNEAQEFLDEMPDCINPMAAYTFVEEIEELVKGAGTQLRWSEKAAGLAKRVKGKDDDLHQQCKQLQSTAMTQGADMKAIEAQISALQKEVRMACGGKWDDPPHDNCAWKAMQAKACEECEKKYGGPDSGICGICKKAEVRKASGGYATQRACWCHECFDKGRNSDGTGQGRATICPLCFINCAGTRLTSTIPVCHSCSYSCVGGKKCLLPYAGGGANMWCYGCKEHVQDCYNQRWDSCRDTMDETFIVTYED
eukprot:GFYU01007178.1.p1 GENE.GFYU01007178.1~~GFYU01007178.1.p1  ORF type:complete len:586 (-),score=162.01 GFYU01007178.1:145-1902(-)